MDKGIRKAMNSKKCIVCGSRKEIKVVVTHHGIHDLHLPCCSNDCMEVVADVILGQYERLMRGRF